MQKYILDDKVPVIESNLFVWAEWCDDIDNRRVAMEALEDEEVSTVFLGVDYGFCGPLPILFETLISGGQYDGYTKRYTTWQQAERGHQLIVRARLNGDAPFQAKGE